MTRLWELGNCIDNIIPIDFQKYVDNIVIIKRIAVSGTEQTGYFGTNECGNAVVKGYNKSTTNTFPDYVTFRFINNDGELSAPINLYIQYADNAFADLSVSNADYIYEIIDELQKWDNPLSAANIKILQGGFNIC